MKYFRLYDVSDQPRKNAKILRDFCRIFVLSLEADPFDNRLTRIVVPEVEQKLAVVYKALLLLCHMYRLECTITEVMSFEDAVAREAGKPRTDSRGDDCSS